MKVPCCKICNSLKGDKSFYEFRRVLIYKSSQPTTNLDNVERFKRAVMKVDSIIEAIAAHNTAREQSSYPECLKTGKCKHICWCCYNY